MIAAEGLHLFLKFGDTAHPILKCHFLDGIDHHEKQSIHCIFRLTMNEDADSNITRKLGADSR
jgi:hypothetical protein